jgi:hypothetical protein
MCFSSPAVSVTPRSLSAARLPYAYAGNDPINSSDPNGHATPGTAGRATTVEPEEALIRSVDIEAGNQWLSEKIEKIAGPLDAFGDATMGLEGIGIVPKEFAGGLKAIAAAIVISGKFERHHLFVEALLNDKKVAGVLSELGINIQSNGNKLWALQNGYAAGHRMYSANNLRKVQDVIQRYLSGQLTRKQALEELAKHRRELRKGIKEDPSQLARKKSDMGSKENSKPKKGCKGKECND